MKNNLDLLKSFFENNSSSIIINRISDEIDCFYFYVIDHYAQIYNFEISNNPTNLINESSDLFGSKDIKIIFSNSSSQINKLLQDNNQKIFFTNYKTYKLLNMNKSSINAYNFKSDVIYFLNNILGISDQSLHRQIINHPEFTYSEISKYLVNNKFNAIDITNNSDQLLEIRKKLYQSKNDKNINYHLFYKLLKEEVNYKKFNF